MTNAMHRVLLVSSLLCQIAGAPRVFAQTSTLAPVGMIDGAAERVCVQGKYAYVIAGGALRIFDVTNPSAPQRVGAFTFSERIGALSVSGSAVYAAANFFGIRILDVSNPAVPVLRGSLQMRGSLLAVAPAGANLLVATNVVTGLDVVDVSEAARPVLLTSHFFTDGYAGDVAASGLLAYATDSANGLYIIDLSKPDSPATMSVQEGEVARLLGSGDMPAGSPLVAVSEPVGTQSPKIALLLERTKGLLHISDVSKPRAPVKVTTFRTPGPQQTLDVRGTLAYIGGPEGLQMVDISNPSKPVSAGTFRTARPVRNVALADSLIFVATGNGGVVILRQSP